MPHRLQGRRGGGAASSAPVGRSPSHRSSAVAAAAENALAAVGDEDALPCGSYMYPAVYIQLGYVPQVGQPQRRALCFLAPGRTASSH